MVIDGVDDEGISNVEYVLTSHLAPEDSLSQAQSLLDIVAVSAMKRENLDLMITVAKMKMEIASLLGISNKKTEKPKNIGFRLEETDESTA